MKICNMYLHIIKHCVGLFNECINRKGNLEDIVHKKEKEEGKSKFMHLNSSVWM